MTTQSASARVRLLLPTPRNLVLTGGMAAVSAELERGVDREWARVCGQTGGQSGGERLSVRVNAKASTPGGYTLRIVRDRAGGANVDITGADPAGERHAMATVRQLARVFAAQLPCLEIDDAPAFETRGVMLDVSRDRVPTMEELKRTVDLLAGLKFNHLQLYTEHTFAYAGHEEVWEGWSPITSGEARELDEYAGARGIELSANQNCFGHLAHWLKRPRYQHLAEIEGDGAWKFMNFKRRGPFSLCPVEPRAEEFVRELLGQMLPCFSSGRVNIGCDETFDVGWGRSRGEAERRAAGRGEQALARARAELYFEFVEKVARVCEGHGRRSMMWADIALSHPELLNLMPKGMIGLAWCYEPTDKFEGWVNLLRGKGHEAWVSPGTSSWRSFTGRTTERRGNIADAAEQAARAGAEGFLVCDWGDLGHRQQWPIPLAGIAQAAEAAWNPGRAREFDASAAGIHAFGDPTGQIGTWLDELGDADLEIRNFAGIRNATALFNDLHPPVPDALGPGERAVDADVGMWRNVREKLHQIAGRMPAIESNLVRREVEQTLEVAEFAADHAIAVRDGIAARGRAELMDRASGIMEEHRALWMHRSRPGGLEHSCSYYEAILAQLRAGE